MGFTDDEAAGLDEDGCDNERFWIGRRGISAGSDDALSASSCDIEYEHWESPILGLRKGLINAEKVDTGNWRDIPKQSALLP